MFLLSETFNFSFLIVFNIFCIADDSQIDILKDVPDYEDRSEEYETLYTHMAPSDATLQRQPFMVNDFIVGMSHY